MKQFVNFIHKAVETIISWFILWRELNIVNWKLCNENGDTEIKEN